MMNECSFLLEDCNALLAHGREECSVYCTVVLLVLTDECKIMHLNH